MKQARIVTLHACVGIGSIILPAEAVEKTLAVSGIYLEGDSATVLPQTLPPNVPP